MSSNSSLTNQQLQSAITTYETTAFATEDGSNESNVDTFHNSGGGSYAFGLFQFDPAGNPGTAVPLLKALGFSSDEIGELQQPSGLSKATLATLDAKLQAALSTTEGQAAMSAAQAQYESGLSSELNSFLGSANTSIAAQIEQDPIALQRMLDLENQFKPTTLSSSEPTSSAFLPRST